MLVALFVLAILLQVVISGSVEAPGLNCGSRVFSPGSRLTVPLTGARDDAGRSIVRLCQQHRPCIRVCGRSSSS